MTKKYLSKDASPRVGVTCKAWEGAELLVNLETGTGIIKLKGYNSGQDVADKKDLIDTIKIPVEDVSQLDNYEAMYTELVTKITSDGLLKEAVLIDVPAQSE